MIDARQALVTLVASVSMLPGVVRAQDSSPVRVGGEPAVVFKAGVDLVTSADGLSAIWSAPISR